MAPRGTSSRWNRRRVHDLRLSLKTHGGLVWSRGLSPRLHGLLDLTCPGASCISWRGRVVDLETVQPTVKAHLPLWQGLPLGRDVGRRQQSRRVRAIGVEHHGRRSPSPRRGRPTRDGIKGLDSGQANVLLLRAVVDNGRQGLRRRVKLRRRDDLVESASWVGEVTAVWVPGPPAPCFISNAVCRVASRPPRRRGRGRAKQAGVRRTKRGGVRGILRARHKERPAQIARPMRRLEGIHARRHTEPPPGCASPRRVHAMAARVRGGGRANNRAPSRAVLAGGEGGRRWSAVVTRRGLSEREMAGASAAIGFHGEPGLGISRHDKRRWPPPSVVPRTVSRADGADTRDAGR